MKVSGFTFLRNGQKFGYPFLESIRSVLPICDEFIVNLGPCDDDTAAMLQTLDEPKVRIIHNVWNDKMCSKGYVYGQQKNIAHFNCTGDWAFYLEADEVLHEDDLPAIRAAMERHLPDERIEALIFDYIHFYGNHCTTLWSPAWYRRAPRIIRNSIRSYSPDGLFFLVLETNKVGRYPNAAHAGAKIFHYGWVRSQEQMDRKLNSVGKYWGGSHTGNIDYSQIDSRVLCEYTGSHPGVMKDWLPENVDKVFRADPNYQLTSREKKHRLGLLIERILGVDLSKKHFKLIG